MTGQEAREAAGADRNALLLQDLAQFVQEDLWPGLIGLQNQLGMSLDAVRALIAALALPWRLGVRCPGRACCRDQRLTLARLTPNRSAAWRQDAPDTTAQTTRQRRSTDKAEGIGRLLGRPTHPASAQFQLARAPL